MAVRTEPRQPVVYDMMLLADALVCLQRFEDVSQLHPPFCERQKNLETALTKIRSLAQFMSGTGESTIKVTDPEFGGSVDRSFMTGLFDRISKYVSHLEEQRYKKEAKYPQPTALEAQQSGKAILTTLKSLIDSTQPELTGDAAHWYDVFKERFAQL